MDKIKLKRIERTIDESDDLKGRMIRHFKVKPIINVNVNKRLNK